MARQSLNQGSTEIEGVSQLICHLSKGELEGLDDLQGGPSIDPDTGLREYSKLAKIIKIPQVQAIFKDVALDFEDDGKISGNVKKVYQEAKKRSLPFKEAPQDKTPPTSIIEKMGSGEDKLLALVPENLVVFLVDLNGGKYSINRKTGLLEFGLLDEVIRIGATIGGAFLGGPIGAGLGNMLGNKVTGADWSKSLKRGLGAGVGAWGLQGLGQMAGLSGATPFTGGFFGAGAQSAANASIPVSQVGVPSATSLATQHAVASPGILSSLGNIASSPMGLMGGMALLNYMADKRGMKDQNRRADLHNREIDKMKEEMGYNLPPIDRTRKSRWVKNPNYRHDNQENPYLNEPQPYKKGGFVKYPVLSSFTKSTGIYGPGNGQDDKIKTKIPAGSYIIDASTTADLGDGSSDSGIKALEKTSQEIRKQYHPKVVKKLEDYFKQHGKLTPVYLANQEFKYDPVDVTLAGGLTGKLDIKKGASLFKGMVKEVREHKRKNGLGLPPRAKSPMDYIKKAAKL
jgi:hypothetical protein